MITGNVIREISPLMAGDCFTIFSKITGKFDLPLHYHEAYELNLILNAKGAKRVLGDHEDTIEDMELVLIGPNVYHAWFTHECKSDAITETTIQFHKDLFDDKFLRRNQLSFLRTMLERAQRGITFAPETILTLKDRIANLDKKSGFDSVLELLSILHDLSTSRNMKTLSEPAFNHEKLYHNSRRLEKVFEFLNNSYYKQITLADAARLAHMPETSFSRFIRKNTGKTFTDSLNEIRLAHASRMLIESTTTVAEIAYKCGFNNISNFNRVFKRKKRCIPREFRETYSGNRVFI